MGTINAKFIIDKAAIQLIDIQGVRWTREELLGWINDAQRTIVMVAPNSSNYLTTIKMEAGTLQSIPADGWILLDVYRNMGTTGDKPGRAIRVVSKELMDAFNPDWHSDKAATAVKNVVYDIQNQTQFWVYPPSDGTGYLEVNYARLPVPCSSETDVIYVNDILQTAILDYVMYRACSKDAEYAPGLALAQGYWAAFTLALGAKADAEKLNSINQTLRPDRDHSIPGAQS